MRAGTGTNIEKRTIERKHRVTSEPYADVGQTPRVRLSMSLVEAQAVADLLSLQCVASDGQRLLDQLWLRTVLIEQWRRTRVAERRAFQERADRTLRALDP